MAGDEAKKKLANMKAVALLGPLTVRPQRVNKGAMNVPTVAAIMPYMLSSPAIAAKAMPCGNPTKATSKAAFISLPALRGV